MFDEPQLRFIYHIPNLKCLAILPFYSIPFICSFRFVVSGMHLIFKHIKFTLKSMEYTVCEYPVSISTLAANIYLYGKMNLILIKIQLNFHLPDNKIQYNTKKARIRQEAKGESLFHFISRTHCVPCKRCFCVFVYVCVSGYSVDTKKQSWNKRRIIDPSLFLSSTS